MKKESESGLLSSEHSRHIEIIWPKLLNFDNQFWLSAVKSSEGWKKGASLFKLPPNLSKTDSKTWLATKSEKAKQSKKSKSAVKSDLAGWLSDSCSLATSSEEPNSGKTSYPKLRSGNSIIGSNTAENIHTNGQTGSTALTANWQVGVAVGGDRLQHKDQKWLWKTQQQLVSNDSIVPAPMDKWLSSGSNSFRKSEQLLKQWSSVQTQVSTQVGAASMSNSWLSDSPTSINKTIRSSSTVDIKDNSLWLATSPEATFITNNNKCHNPWLAQPPQLEEKAVVNTTVSRHLLPKSMNNSFTSISQQSSGPLTRTSSSCSLESWLSSGSSGSCQAAPIVTAAVILPSNDNLSPTELSMEAIATQEDTATWISVDLDRSELGEEGDQSSILTLDTLTEEQDLNGEDASEENNSDNDNIDLTEWLLY